MPTTSTSTIEDITEWLNSSQAFYPENDDKLVANIRRAFRVARQEPLLRDALRTAVEALEWYANHANWSQCGPECETIVANAEIERGELADGTLATIRETLGIK